MPPPSLLNAFAHRTARRATTAISGHKAATKREWNVVNSWKTKQGHTRSILASNVKKISQPAAELNAPNAIEPAQSLVYTTSYCHTVLRRWWCEKLSSERSRCDKSICDFCSQLPMARSSIIIVCSSDTHYRSDTDTVLTRLLRCYVSSWSAVLTIVYSVNVPFHFTYPSPSSSSSFPSPSYSTDKR